MASPPASFLPPAAPTVALARVAALGEFPVAVLVPGARAAHLGAPGEACGSSATLGVEWSRSGGGAVTQRGAEKRAQADRSAIRGRAGRAAGHWCEPAAKPRVQILWEARVQRRLDEVGLGPSMAGAGPGRARAQRAARRPARCPNVPVCARRPCCLSPPSRRREPRGWRPGYATNGAAAVWAGSGRPGGCVPEGGKRSRACLDASRALTAFDWPGQGATRGSTHAPACARLHAAAYGVCAWHLVQAPLLALPCAWLTGDL